MAAYKDDERGTWYVSFYYTDWTGVRKRKVKRGFHTKREALKFENDFQRKSGADMNMTFEEFVEVYFEDKSKEVTIQNPSLFKDEIRGT